MISINASCSMFVYYGNEIFIRNYYDQLCFNLLKPIPYPLPKFHLFYRENNGDDANATKRVSRAVAFLCFASDDATEGKMKIKNGFSGLSINQSNIDRNQSRMLAKVFLSWG
jgi:hypothetical protein